MQNTEKMQFNLLLFLMQYKGIPLQDEKNLKPHLLNYHYFKYFSHEKKIVLLNAVIKQ